jgi:hypothetical protein
MPENPSAHGRLDSWKEIADYLKRDVRTVIRWEKEKRLPVHRVPGGLRQSVFAYANEIDDWLEKGAMGLALSPQQSANAASVIQEPSALERQVGVATAPQARPRSTYLVLALGIGLVAVILGWLVFTTHTVRSNPPLRIDFTANSIQAFDAQSRLIWTHKFPKPLDLDYLKQVERLTDLVRIADLDGDSEPEVLVTVPFAPGPNSNDFFQMELDCFSSSGKPLWSYVAHEKFQFGNYSLEGPWNVTDVLVSSQATKAVIWVSLGHYKWGNSFVVQLDPATGKDVLRFVNTGVLYKLNEVQIAGRQYLLAAGFNNEYAAGSLAVMDESKAFAVSPQTTGTRHKCVSCPQGDTDYYFIFPRSEMNLRQNLWEDSVHSITVNGEEIETEKWEGYSPELGLAPEGRPMGMREYYVFHTLPTIQPFSFRFSSDYDMLHRELEKEHKLNHTLESCPERLHPKPVKVWTPSAGWKDIKLNPVRAVD